MTHEAGPVMKPEKKTADNAIVISEHVTHPWRIQHPRYIPRSSTQLPQVIAKHHVTSQQVGNAIETLVHDEYKDIPFVVPSIIGCHAEEIEVACSRCNLQHYLTRLSIHIHNTVDTISMTITRTDIHNMIYHGQKARPNLVCFLGLKPNTCYLPVYKWELYWKRVYRYNIINDATDTDNFKGFDKAMELYRYDQKGIRAIVYNWDKGNTNRYLALRVREPHDIRRPVIIEGVLINTHYHAHSLYQLEWKRVPVVPDWLQKPASIN